MIRPLITTAAVAVLLAIGGGEAPAQSTNPCAAKNPGGVKAANPCAARNPCAATNPCAAGGKVDARLIRRPAGVRPASAPSTELVALGERLWKDPSLSTNKLSCQTCHQGNANFNASFAKPYPHPVAMAKERAGLAQIDADEMVQICMVVPMAAKPLPWNSKELAGLTAYVKQLQKSFKPPAASANPCAAKNPCAARNPCAAKNPCAAQNPCAPRKP